MTVLRRRDARGFEPGPIRKFAVGAAFAVVGVAAAFGLSQVIDQEATPAPVATTPAERNAIAEAQALRAESMHRLDQSLIEKYNQLGAQTKSSAEWTLDDEIAAIKARAMETSPTATESTPGAATDSRSGLPEPRPE
jgi:hypothetical protein